MSQAPHCMHLRNGAKMGDAADGRHHDQGRAVGRLQRLPHGQHRRERRAEVADHARAAGRVRRRLAAEGRGGAEGRPLQGRDRRRSRSRAARATWSSTPTSIRKHGTTVEALAKLRPAFDKDGTVTAGNASGINDGAAAVVLMTRRGGGQARPEAAGAHRLLGDRRASIRRSWARGPIPASRAALEKAGWKLDDLDLIEANEAFAAQACAVNKDLGWDTEQGQRQWRRHRARPSDRRVGRARAGHAAARDAEARRARRASPRCASAAAWASRMCVER